MTSKIRIAGSKSGNYCLETFYFLKNNETVCILRTPHGLELRIFINTANLDERNGFILAFILQDLP